MIKVLLDQIDQKLIFQIGCKLYTIIWKTTLFQLIKWKTQVNQLRRREKMKKWSLLVFLALILILSACSNKEYESAMTTGYENLQNTSYDKALTQFEKALGEEETEEVKQAIDVVEDMLKAEQAFLQGDWGIVFNIEKKLKKQEDEAANLVIKNLIKLKEQSELIQEEQENFTDLLAKADELLQQKKYDEAISLYQQITNSKTDHAIIQDLIDQAKEQQTKAEKVKSDYLAEQQRIAKEKEEAKQEEIRKQAERKKQEDIKKAEEAKQATQGISPQQAENMIRQASGVPSSTSVVHDHDEGENYLIHVYDVIDDGNGMQHSATRGWYAVNKTTGEWFDWMASF